MASGFAPYEEATIKARMRLSGIQNAISSALGGLGAVPPGANFGTAFLAASGRSSQLYNESQRAAEQYAMKQIEAERDRESRLALEEARKKPPKPTKPTKDEEAIRILGRPLTEVERRKLAGVYIAPARPSIGKKTAKPVKIPRRIPAGVTEQEIIDSINAVTDDKVLTAYFTGRAQADSPEIRRAAQLRANDLMRSRR